MSIPPLELIAEAKTALRRGDGAAARPALEAALELGEAGELLEHLGQAAYLEFEFVDCIRFYERAYAAYRDEENGTGAVHIARLLGYMNGMIVGDRAVMSGWIARASTLLNDDDSLEKGWVSLVRSMFEQDRPTKNTGLREALTIARRFHDTDLELVSLAYLGASLVHGDEVEAGMLLLDEALAAITGGGEVQDFLVYEEIFCQLFSACEQAHDVARADEWIRAGDEIAKRRNLPAVSAFCRTHYGGLLTSAGRWEEADAALTEAARIWGLGFGPLRGGALIRLADLRVGQGRFEEAEQLLVGFDGYTEAARSLATIHLARGDAILAADVVERALAQLEPGSATTGPLLAVLLDVHLQLGDIAAANVAAEQLDLVASTHPSQYMKATASLARGKLCLATGAGDPTVCLREALSGFAKAQVPMELASARVELARAVRADRPEVAVAEAKSALETFEQLQATRHADATAALLRDLGAPARTGPKAGGVLTKREAEVLELLGHGMSNPEISDRLFISRKTVEHHVGNVLAKLQLRSRAEAAAYMARSENPGHR